MKKMLLSTFALLLGATLVMAQCPTGLEITEVLVDPNGNTFNFDTDGNGSAETNDEFVKICNTSTAAIDAGGLILNDIGGGGDWFTFPSPTMIMPGTCVTVVSDWDEANAPVPAGVFDANHGTSGIINNSGDPVNLFSGGTLCQTFDAVPGTDGCVQSATDEEIACGDPAAYDFTAPSDGPLSIQLLDFTATAEKENVMLEWQTVAETNNDYFVIENSIDGRSFEQVGEILGAGTSNERIAYDFMHENALVGLNYYRLKQVDFDGRFSYSDVKSVEIKSNNTISVYPTFVSQDVNIRLSENLKNDTQIQVVDMMGQLILASSFNKDNNLKVINVANLTSGTYFLILNIDGDINTTKFMKL